MRNSAPEYFYHTRVRRGPSGLHNTGGFLAVKLLITTRCRKTKSLSLTSPAPMDSYPAGRYRARCSIR